MCVLSATQKAGSFTTILFILFYKNKDVHKLITIDHINAHNLLQSAEAFMSVTRLLVSMLPSSIYVAAPYSIPEEKMEVVGTVPTSNPLPTSVVPPSSLLISLLLIHTPSKDKKRKKELLSMPLKRILIYFKVYAGFTNIF